jgi:hypothetical protein
MGKSAVQEQSGKVHPWELIWGQPYIDANRLASAIEFELASSSRQDFRTRLLIRDAVRALMSYKTARQFAEWMNHSPEKLKIEGILREDLGEAGYHNIRERLVTNIKRNELEQVFELLARNISKRTEVCLAGSIPTLMTDLTARPTDDIDFIDEIPESIREQRGMLIQIARKYGLTLGHVQSHYLPKNWEARRQLFGTYGNLLVYVADEYDIFVSKLSSKLEKHQDDLRVMSNQLNKEIIKERLQGDGKAFLENSFDRPTIESNWEFIYREPLVTD